MDVRDNFTHINSILLPLLLARITNELFIYYKHLKTQFFFICLLTLVAGQPCFRLMVSLSIGLAIGKAALIDKKFAVGFFVCFL